MTPRTTWIALLAGCTLLAAGCVTEETPGTAEVRITPVNPSLLPGEQVTLEARAYDRGGQLLAGRTASWHSRTQGIATVGSASGVVTALEPGIAVIGATIDGHTSLVLITVAIPAVESVRIEPGSASIRTGDIKAFTAVALDRRGIAIPGRVPSWQTSAPQVVTLTGGGVVIAVGAGQAVISATIEGHSGSATIEVLPRAAAVAISGPSTLDVVADTAQLTAVVRDGSGTVVPSWPVTWVSSNPQVVTVSQAGKISSQGLGTAMITATSELVQDVHHVTVTQMPVTHATIAPIAGLLSVNRILQLQVVPYAPDGRPLRGRVATWTSSNPAVASVSSSGLLSTITPGQTVVTALLEGVQASRPLEVVDRADGGLSLGTWHSCSVGQNGQVQCWGSRPAAGTGQDTCLDVTYYNNPFPCLRTPTAVAGGGQLVSVSAGAWHSCGLTAAGAAWCWGNNAVGELGAITPAGSSEVPVPVGGGHSFGSLALGYLFSCGLKAGGEAYCWGTNTQGQLGNGSSLPAGMPGPVAGGLRFVRLTAGDAHVCGLTDLGKAFCWGFNGSGQLGDGSNANKSTPTPVNTVQTFVDIDAGSYNTCAVTVSGAAWCWGNGQSGEIGDGLGVTRLLPSAVAGGHQLVRISVGNGVTCGIRIDGAGLCWGGNGYGQLGDGTTTNRPVPTLVAGSLSFVDMSVGNIHVCARAAGGALYCWGQGMTGALGLGADVANQKVPKRVLGNP